MDLELEYYEPMMEEAMEIIEERRPFLPKPEQLHWMYKTFYLALEIAVVTFYATFHTFYNNNRDRMILYEIYRNALSAYTSTQRFENELPSGNEE